MKIFCLITLFLCITLSGCRNKKTDYSRLYGFWEKELVNKAGHQQFVAYFSQKGTDIECQFHSYLNGVKFSPEIGADIEFDGEFLSFIANQNADVCYQGKLDSSKSTISGKLIYADGSDLEFNLKKINKEKLLEKYPGLLNLTKNDHQIKQPEYKDDGWKIASLTQSRVDSNSLYEMTESIRDKKWGEVHSVLIAEDGKLIFEKYFEGFFYSDLNSLQSCTKSIGSILTGIAIDKGYIKSVDQKILDFFPEYKDKSDQNWENVKLKNLLTMSMGLDWDKDLHEKIYGISNDVIKTAFKQKFSHEPGEIFEYRNPQTDILGGIIMRTTKQSVQDFAEEYLFGPLNIKKFFWENYKETGYPLMSGSLALSSRSMLKIGQMVLDKGMWNDARVVAEKWIDESTSFKIKSDQTFGYAYLWWLGESQTKPGVKAVFAMGISGQLIVIIPDMNSVIVITAGNMDREPEFLLNMIDEYIVKNSG